MAGQNRSSITAEKKDAASVLINNEYGKSAVKLTKVIREKDRHILKEISVDIQLQGQFERSYTDGDNSQVVATDTMKNTIYVLAANDPLDDIEVFGTNLARHFLASYKQVQSVSVHLAEDLWQRISVNGKPHPHSFFGAGDEKRVANIQATRDSLKVESGIDGLKVAKTTASEFCGFVRDKYTTLPEVKDRIFGTSITVHWLYQTETPNYQQAYQTVRDTVLETFATHHSLGVQQTIYEIGEAALTRVPELNEIKITAPNEHRIPFDLKPFGMENKNEIFVLTSEPYGLISATIKRGLSRTT